MVRTRTQKDPTEVQSLKLEINRLEQELKTLSIRYGAFQLGVKAALGMPVETDIQETLAEIQRLHAVASGLEANRCPLCFGAAWLFSSRAPCHGCGGTGKVLVGYLTMTPTEAETLRSICVAHLDDEERLWVFRRPEGRTIMTKLGISET